MKRREFIKSAAIAAVGLSIPSVIDTIFNNSDGAERIDLVVSQGRRRINC
ncbi:MAG: hypothetical protein ACK415_05700 [Thermodesulfovibrionales bacterium]